MKTHSVLKVPSCFKVNPIIEQAFRLGFHHQISGKPLFDTSKFLPAVAIAYISGGLAAV